VQLATAEHSMQSEGTAVDELFYSSDDEDMPEQQRNFVDDVNIPGFTDDALYYLEVTADDNRRLADNRTETLARSTRTDAGSSSVMVPVPDFDGAVISVFAVAVILLVVGQAVVVCRQRHRRSCQRRCRKWNVPVFGGVQLPTASSHHGGFPVVRRSPPPSEIWTALPSSSPLPGLFQADNYRTPAFAYINRRSSDSLPSNAAVASPSDSSDSAASSTAAFVRAGSSVTWSDIGEMTSSSPEKRLTTSLSLTSSEVATHGGRFDDEEQTDEGQTDHAPATETQEAATNNSDDAEYSMVRLQVWMTLGVD